MHRSLTCRLIPYKVFPNATISPGVLTTSAASDVSLLCKNIGDSTFDTFFKWYLNELPLEKHPKGINITIRSENRTSSLRISGTIPNNTVFTCQVVIPRVATSNASTTLFLTSDYLSSNTPSKRPNKDCKDQKIFGMPNSVTFAVFMICTSIIFFLVGLICGVSCKSMLSWMKKRRMCTSLKNRKGIINEPKNNANNEHQSKLEITSNRKRGELSQIVSYETVVNVTESQYDEPFNEDNKYCDYYITPE